MKISKAATRIFAKFDMGEVYGSCQATSGSSRAAVLVSGGKCFERKSRREMEVTVYVHKSQDFRNHWTEGCYKYTTADVNAGIICYPEKAIPD
jgi:hypothetical protein